MWMNLDQLKRRTKLFSPFMKQILERGLTSNTGEGELKKVLSKKF